jgi:hypothetical protein
MALSKQEFKQFIRDFNFREMFNEMGWDRDNTTQSVRIDDHVFNLTSAGAKSGFKVFVCGAGADGRIPDYATRKKVETAVRRLYPEHLIIFPDSANTEQLWQFVARQSGKPTRVTETRWNKDQEPELLFQRASGVFFELDEEDNITIVDVTQRIAANFDQNNERVTKRFYERFTKEHKTFSAFVTGIDDHIDKWNKANPKDQKENQNKQWYVSLMLNRLMFCYFIQKKGFLDKNKNYLRDKLRECRERKGKNKYYSFYRDFLMALFHEGLGTPDHSAKLKAEIGRIPYLNGGLFDEHELEKQFDMIEIDDDAFEKIFEFFDQYEWHLDTRHTASGKDINPDVIGYIFEKYINERAAMGAYYTKEDITDYISKNCVLPFLFDETKRNYSGAFKPNGEIWSMLRASGDKYIYDAVKKGVELELPENISIGIDTTKPNLLDRRKDWNKKAPAEYALPTEIWREVIDRRRRYVEAKAKIESGEITGINDFITYNLNIRQFAQDVVENTTDPKFLEHFYKALSSVTILDPTCGSGAFLFAAMNILEPLYQACIQRMRNFTEDEDRVNLEDKRTFGHKFPFFREVLEDIQNPAHPNLQYFVYKSIILRNLYGVDIMKEAVEVAKLRLFLKLVATVDADYTKPNLGLEPLPDIDFNIRAGNTLIGYVSQKQIDELAALLITADDKRKLLEECDIVARAFRRYKEIQLSQETDFEEFKDAKDDLNARLKNLNESLDRTLFKQSYEGMDYDRWKETHQPFHWFAEFYENVHDRGGFDAIIGNPPYVERRTISYEPKHLLTYSTNNLYAYSIERGKHLLSPSGRFGFIIPLSSFATDKFQPLQNLLSAQSNMWLSNYDDRPSRLFDGLEHIQLTIVLFEGHTSKQGSVFTTRCYKWSALERPFLFNNIAYAELDAEYLEGSIEKIGTAVEVSIARKIWNDEEALGKHLVSDSNNTVYYTRKVHAFLNVLDFVPKITDQNGARRDPSEQKTLHFPNRIEAHAALTVLNSTLFRWFLTTYSDCRNLNRREVLNFPVNLRRLAASYGRDTDRLADSLSANLKATSEIRQMRFGGDSLRIQCIIPKHSKPIIDEIDKVLAKHYGFTEEELDFIINYDIKYRMGAELDGDVD